jgi:hypothetical protein
VAKKTSRRLIIDASVARSATMSQDPTSTACREFLQEVFSICHRAVLTHEIEREWQYAALEIHSKADEARSRFLVGWMGAMARKGKLLRPLVVQNTALRKKINHLGLPEQDRLAISEDVHLIEAALASDHVVISRDDAVYKLLRGITGSCPEIRKVVWCNPVALGYEALEWLRNRAAPVKAWQLGARR